jgi:electron transfer flavoprotein alpha subunit
MARIFAYIVHKAGVADDSAAQLAAAAKKIDPTASPTALLTGWGADLNAACRRAALCWLRTSISESIWRRVFPSS